MGKVRFLCAFVACLGMLYASGGGGGGVVEQGEHYYCFGYGDGKGECIEKDDDGNCKKYDNPKYSFKEGAVQDNGHEDYVNCVKKDRNIDTSIYITNLRPGTNNPLYVFNKCITEGGRACYDDCNGDPMCMGRCDICTSTIANNYIYQCHATGCHQPPGLSGKPSYDSMILCTSGCYTASIVKRPVDGGGGTQPPKPGNLIVFENYNSPDILTGKDDNKIYVKITGETKKLLIKDDEGNAGITKSGLKDATCTLKDPQGKTTSLSTYKTTFNLQPRLGVDVKPLRAGDYTLQCSGTNSKDEFVQSPEIPFYSAPKTYDVQLFYKGDAITDGFNVNSMYKNKNDSAEIKIKQDFKRPMVKMGDGGLNISVTSNAKDFNGGMDVGINGNLRILNLINGNKVDVKNANSSNPNNTPGGACYAEEANNVAGTPKYSNGNINQAMLANVDYKDVLHGVMDLEFSDNDNYNKIQAAETAGLCNSGILKQECPYPPRFKVAVPFSILPFNFKAGLKTTSGDNIRVMYFGQGGNPASEQPINLELTALGLDNTTALKNFTPSCASLSTGVELKSQKNDISIGLIDPKTQQDDPFVYKSDFIIPDSTGAREKILAVKKFDGSFLMPNEVKEPVYLDGFDTNKAYVQYCSNPDDMANPNLDPNKCTKDASGNPIGVKVEYDNPAVDSGLDNVVILRGRINVIDAYNTDGQGKTNGMPITKVYHEFYCKTCDLDKLAKITGIADAAGKNKYQNSPTIYGWFIDETFEKFNKQQIKADHIELTNNLTIDKIEPPKNGIEEIYYKNALSGKYQIKINQKVCDPNDIGNPKQCNKPKESYPSYLLFTPYYDVNNNYILGTSANVYVNSSLQDENRDFGVDSGAAKNTKGSSRTGGF